jgi:hypothetical protein
MVPAYERREKAIKSITHDHTSTAAFFGSVMDGGATFVYRYVQGVFRL